MQVLQLFRPLEARQPSCEELVALVSRVPGTEVEGRPGGTHRLARWRDAATNAACLIHIGEPPLEADTLHPPRAYRGWAPLELSLHLPLSGPHWFCVEALAVCEALLGRDPGWRALDEEDIPPASGGGDIGPGPWSRPRVIANWERLRAAQIETRVAVCRMRRSASVAMWRYRREAPRASLEHGGFHWPPASAMRDSGGAARSVCVWMRPDQPLALPPVELVIIGSERPVVVAHESLADVLAREGLLRDAGIAGAALAQPMGPDLIARLPQRGPGGMSALDDDSWCD